MELRPSKHADRTRSLALRVDRGRESRLALALIMLLSLATLSVLAATRALSQHHASELATLTSP